MSKALRTIGEPRVRMAEDPVGILRAIKFATRLGFRIEDSTWSAMCELAPALERSAKPPLLEELLRLVRSGTALGAFRMLRACGALAVVLPQVDAFLGRRDDPDPAAHDRADSYWRLLEALDADVHAGNQPSTAVCVAVLFLRLSEREAENATRTLAGPPGELAEVADEVLEPFAVASRLSRRDCARARRIVSLQRRFTQPASKRFRPMLFARSEEFSEALHLFRRPVQVRREPGRLGLRIEEDPRNPVEHAEALSDIAGRLGLRIDQNLRDPVDDAHQLHCILLRQAGRLRLRIDQDFRDVAYDAEPLGHEFRSYPGILLGVLVEAREPQVDLHEGIPDFFGQGQGLSDLEDL